MSAIKHVDINPFQADSLVILTQKILSALGGGIGAGGSQRIVGAGDSTAGKTVFCFIPNADTVIGAATGNATGLVGATCYAGIPVYGIWTGLTQASGDGTYYFLP